MRIYLSRHGETDNNAQGIISGASDIARLNQRGRQHAMRIAELYKGIAIEAIYTSPLTRAVDTAFPLAKAKHLPLMKDSRLIEFDFGIVDGEFNDEAKVHWVQRAKDLYYKFPEGECYNDVIARVTSFLDYLKSLNHQSAFIFSHQGTGRAIVALLTDQDLTDPKNLSSIIQPNPIVYQIDTNTYDVEWLNTETNERGQGLLRKFY